MTGQLERLGTLPTSLARRKSWMATSAAEGQMQMRCSLLEKGAAGMEKRARRKL